MDNLDPIGTTKIQSIFSALLKPLMNNRGEVNAGDGGEGGGGEGSGEGSGEGGAGEGTAGAGSAGAAVAEGWRSGLDPTIKDHPSLANFKTPSDMAKSYIEAQKFVGREKIPKPPKDSKPEDWEVVYNSLGRPSDPNAYKLPEVQYVDGMPQASEDMNNDFKNVAHKLGLLPHQVEGLYKWNHDRNTNHFTQISETSKENLQKAETDLRKEWGKAYDGNLGLVRNLLGQFGDDSTNELIESGLGNDPRFIRFAYKVAKNFGEDGQFLGGDSITKTMTPEEATKEISLIRNDKKHPYHNKMHPEHMQSVKYMSDLYEMAFPDERKR